jgi:hypothetical protein
LYDDRDLYARDRLILISDNPILEVYKTIGGNTSLACFCQAGHFLLWVIVAGLAIVLFPARLDLIVFESGHGFVPRPPRPNQELSVLRSYVPYLAITSSMAVTLLAWSLGREQGSLLVAAVLSRTVWVWGGIQESLKPQSSLFGRQRSWRAFVLGCDQQEGTSSS